MYHPAIYVLVTDLDDREEMPQEVERKPETKCAQDITAVDANNCGIKIATKSTITANNMQKQQSTVFNIPSLNRSTVNASTTTTTQTATAAATMEKQQKKQMNKINENHAENNNNKHNNNVGLIQNNTTLPCSYYYGTSTSSSFTCNTTNTHAVPQAASEMPERAWQDCISSSHYHQTMSQNIDNCALKTNNNIDENLTVMTGTENNNLINNSNINQNSNMLNDAKSFMQQKHKSFWGFVDPTAKTNCACAKTSLKNTTLSSHDGSGSVAYARNTIGDALLVTAMSSPNTPSPHPPNSAHSQPTSIPSAEHLLTISPRGGPTSISSSQQPPTPIDSLLDKNTPAPTPTPTDQHDNKSLTSPFVVHTGGGNFDTNSTVSECLPAHLLNLEHCSSTTTPPASSTMYTQIQPTTTTTTSTSTATGTITVKKFDTQLPVDVADIKLEPDLETKPGSTQHAAANSTNSGVDNTAMTSAMRDYLKFYCPPKLPVKNVDTWNNEDSPKYEALYDFSSNDAWFNYTIKRFKPNDEPKPRRYLLNKNIYDSHTHYRSTLPTAATLYNNARTLALHKQQQLANSGNSFSGDAESELDRFPALSSNSSSVSTMLTCNTDNQNDMITSNISRSGNNAMDTSTTPANIVEDMELKHSTVTSFFNDLNIKTEMNLSPNKDKLNIGGNLFTAEGLNPSLNDLEQLFETSSNDDCSNLQLHSPPDSNNPKSSCATANADTTNLIVPSTMSTSVVGATATAAATATATAVATCAGAGAGASGGGGGGGMGAFHSVNPISSTTLNVNKQQTNYNFVSSSSSSSVTNTNTNTNTTTAVEDLTKMFPTPPSHEQHHPSSSPCQIDMNAIETATATNSMDASCNFSKIKQECEYETIEDWSYVFRPPKQSVFVGSSKYAPLLQLPSHSLPPIVMPAHLVYKPSNWKTQHQQKQQQQLKQQQNKQQHSALTINYQMQQQQQQQQQHKQQLPHYHQQQQQQQQQQQPHQHLHELLSQTPRPIQLPRYNNITNNSTLSNTYNTNNSGNNSLLLNQLNCPQASINSTHHHHHQQQQQQQQQQHQQQLIQRSTSGMSPISPTLMRNSPLTQRHLPPPSYELSVVSPATSTSSYLNKQLNSQETPHTPQSLNANAAYNLGGHQSSLQNLGQIGNNCISNLAALSRDLPEVSSLLVNILLYDTALNVFRDHNFDSSTVCVCNADSSKVGNIRGADSGVYVPLPGSSFKPTPSAGVHTQLASHLPRPSSASGLKMLNTFSVGGNSGSFIGAATNSSLDSPGSLPGAGSGHTNSSSSNSSCITNANNNNSTQNSHQHITGYVDDDPVDCTCGFSAVVNRRLAYRAGLFYEDEQEITGCAEDPALNKKPSLRALILNLNAAFDSSNTRNMNSSSEKINIQADQTMYAIFDLLLAQCTIIQNSSSSIHRALHRHRLRLSKDKHKPFLHTIYNVLEYVDAHDLVCLALEQARLTNSQSRIDEQQLSPFGGNTNNNTNQRFKRFASSAFNAVINSNSNFNATVHKWSFIPVGFQRSNKEIVHTMNSIQPMLQNAFHSKSRSAAGSKEATYTVSGPLTWRQFHRLAGRASGQCEPQPIPSVIVGHDKDWISVAPLAIHYWDKFLLEPYSYARDIVYLIMCPDNEYVISKTRTYFKELSTTYEICKLGRHTPMRGWDGMLTIGPRVCSSGNFNTALDDWLRGLSDAALAEKLRYYAYAFQNLIAPYLNRIPTDKTLLQPPDLTSNSSSYSNRERLNPNSSPISTNNITSGNLISTGGSMSANNNTTGHSINANVALNIEIDKSHNTPKLESGSSNADQSMDNNYNDNNKPDIKVEAKPAIILGDPLGMADTLEDINTPAIVLYVVEPFTFGSDSPELERLVCIALLRCYTELLSNIPESVRANLNIQLISLESILELGRTRNRKRFSDEIKALALSIFSQCRRHMLHTQHVKSLTGFGTAANMEVFLKSKDEKNRRAYRMYTPPYILAPMHEKNDKSDFLRASSSIMRGLNEQKYSVMYCNYCMSEDQSWLLATVTDDRGELLEKVCINIDVPNRLRRRKTPARRVGLKKLMDFILGLISQSAQPWRLVIGRIGRIGHSELKSWSYLLSKQNLQKASKQLKDLCKQCTLTYPPSILSACLVTLEPDAKLRVMPDQFTPDERFSQISMQNPLSTPQDVTCTHILVFPTSAVCLVYKFTAQLK